MPISRYWPPVYPGKDHRQRDVWSQVSSFVRREDFLLINSVGGQSGFISHIIDHAIKSTADAIRADGITFANRAEFVEWLGKRTYTPFLASRRERPVGQPSPTPQGQAGDDGRGTQEGGHEAADPTHVTAGAGPTTPAESSSGGVGGRGYGDGPAEKRVVARRRGKVKIEGNENRTGNIGTGSV